MKPTHYHWHIFDKNGAHISTCELRGGRDQVKRIRAKQAKWPDFGAFSRIIAGQY